MPSIQRSQLMPYPTALMFSIANEIEHYPAFLPGCRQAIVHWRREDEVEATLVVGYGLIRESFTTRNRAIGNERIELSLVRGPFHEFHGSWRFMAAGARQCWLSLELGFEFSGFILRRISPLFTSNSQRLFDAFCDRARQLSVK